MMISFGMICLLFTHAALHSCPNVILPCKVPALLAVGIEGAWGFALCAVALPVLSVIRGGDGLPLDDAAGAAKEIAANGALAAAVGVSILSIACFNFFGERRERESSADGIGWFEGVELGCLAGRRSRFLPVGCSSCFGPGGRCPARPSPAPHRPLNSSPPWAGISVTKSLSGAARATIDACRTLFIWVVCIQLGWERFHALQILGFVVLICGSGLYNELLRSCLPGTSPAEGSDAEAAGGAGERRRDARHGRGARRGARGDEEAPLLANEGGGAAGGALPRAPSAPAGHSQPIAAAAPSQAHAAAAAVPAGRRGAAGARRPPTASSPGSEEPFMFARSMRLGPGALFPSSLGGSVPYFGEAEADGGDDGSSYAGSQAGSYYSYGGPSSYGAGGPGGSYAGGGYYSSGYDTPPPGAGGAAGGGGGQGEYWEEEGGTPTAAGPGGGGPPPRGSLLPPGGARPSGGGGQARRGGGSGGGGGRGALAAAMRRPPSGGALAADAARAAAAQQQADGARDAGSGGGRPPAGRSGLAPRPGSSGGAAAPPARQQ